MVRAMYENTLRILPPMWVETRESADPQRVDGEKNIVQDNTWSKDGTAASLSPSSSSQAHFSCSLTRSLDSASAIEIFQKEL
jgi:hypothetical protein